MKKLISAITVLVLLVSITNNVYAVEPRYNNASDLQVELEIDASGLANVTLKVRSEVSLEEIEITVYLQRKVSGTWSRVSIGTANDVWEYTTTGSTVKKTFSTQISRAGTYRAVATFNLRGETLETVTLTATDTY